STSSLSSTILEYRKIHGRTYHAYSSPSTTSTEYWAPNDDNANEQLDINHHLLSLLLDNKLFLAPIDKERGMIHNALDVGTGTGIWAMDFADEFPEAVVTGLDISPIQPTWVPPNVRFVMDDVNDTWTYPDAMFDYIHVRYMTGCVKDWVKMYKEAYRCLKPGGWIEHMDCSVGLWCDDGSIPEGSVFDDWVEMFKKAGPIMGQSFFVIEEDAFVKKMEQAGFTGIKTKVLKMPVGAWPRDAKLKEIGAMNLFAMHRDVEAFALYVTTTVLKWDIVEAQVFLTRIRSELKNKAYHGH
ncbi:S-adenosyl-L-methionine-dependent methyltransferase, partial [Immersiella caudata]